MRTMISLCLSLCLAVHASAAVLGQPKRPYDDRPDDKFCRHVETITESPWTYDIEFSGTVDGVMTRTPIG